MKNKKRVLIYSAVHYAIWLAILIISFICLIDPQYEHDKYGKPVLIYFAQNIFNFPIFTASSIIVKKLIATQQFSPIKFIILSISVIGPINSFICGFSFNKIYEFYKNKRSNKNKTEGTNSNNIALY